MATSQAKTVEQPQPIASAPERQPLLPDDDKNPIPQIPPPPLPSSIKAYTQNRIHSGLQYATTRLKSLHLLPITKEYLLSYSQACKLALEAPSPKRKQALLYHDRQLHSKPYLETDPVGEERKAINAVAAFREAYFVMMYSPYLDEYTNRFNPTTIPTEYFHDGQKWIEVAKQLIAEEEALLAWHETRRLGLAPGTYPSRSTTLAIKQPCDMLGIEYEPFIDMVKLHFNPDAKCYRNQSTRDAHSLRSIESLIEGCIWSSLSEALYKELKEIRNVIPDVRKAENEIMVECMEAIKAKYFTFVSPNYFACFELTKEARAKRIRKDSKP